MRSQCSRSKSFFLASAINLGNKSDSRLSSHIQSSDTFWSINFMTRDTHQIDIHFIDVNFHFTVTLCGICMEECLVISTNLTDFLDWLNRTDFIINVNYTGDKCIWSDCGFEFFNVDKPSLYFYRQVCDFKTLIF